MGVSGSGMMAAWQWGVGKLYSAGGVFGNVLKIFEYFVGMVVVFVFLQRDKRIQVERRREK